MCGICGVVFQSNDHLKKVTSHVKAMLQTMSHRGPDGESQISTKMGSFGHTRLAIVDVAGGNQPIFNEDGSIGIIFNGEIYNYRELRHQLLQKGHLFKTNSDTEVIIHLFEEFHEESFAMLIGMFAFAIWTPNKVYLVRDQIGIKPLYYSAMKDHLVFASEMKGLMAFPDIALTINEQGLRQYLTYRYCPGEQTIFHEIKKLQASHYILIDSCSIVTKNYYNLADNIITIPHGEAGEHIFQVINEVIQSQLMGEVPVGLTLSGGLDSSAIAFYLNRLGASLETFNIGFPSINEFKFSERVARKFHLNHTMVLMDPSELINYLPKYLHAIDEPLADAACLPLYKLCEIIKEQVTVVLSGEGGDEIFGGYPQYWLTAQAHTSPTDHAFRYFLDKSWYFLELNDYFLHGQQNEIIGREHFHGSLVSAMSNYDLHTWVPENLMMKADKILMAHGLEGRFPFLDLRVVRLAVGLPDSAKIQVNQGKWLFKEIMRPHLPRDVVNRAKMGFSVPLDALLFSAKEQVYAALTEPSPLDNFISKRKIRQTMEHHFDGSRPTPLFLWTLFILYQWVKNSYQKNHDAIF